MTTWSAAERKTGEIALYSGRKSEPVATLQLPEADLGRVQSDGAFDGLGVARRIGSKPRRRMESGIRPGPVVGSLHCGAHFSGRRVDRHVPGN